MPPYINFDERSMGFYSREGLIRLDKLVRESSGKQSAIQLIWAELADELSAVGLNIYSLVYIEEFFNEVQSEVTAAFDAIDSQLIEALSKKELLELMKIFEQYRLGSPTLTENSFYYRVFQTYQKKKNGETNNGYVLEGEYYNKILKAFCTAETIEELEAANWLVSPPTEEFTHFNEPDEDKDLILFNDVQLLREIEAHLAAVRQEGLGELVAALNKFIRIITGTFRIPLFQKYSDAASMRVGLSIFRKYGYSFKEILEVFNKADFDLLTDLNDRGITLGDLSLDPGEIAGLITG